MRAESEITRARIAVSAPVPADRSTWENWRSCSGWSAAGQPRRRDDVDQAGALVEGRRVAAAAGYGGTVEYRCAVPFSAASICAGVAVGSAWKSWATMPAMCGAAIDVPLIVLKVPRSSSPGPFCGARPVEQIGR